MKAILFKINSWGLGHATRSLPIIRRLLHDSHRVTVISTGRALRLLRTELQDRCQYLDIYDYNTTWGRDYHWVFLMPKAPIEVARLLRSFRTERRIVNQILEGRNYDLLISDNCYGASSPHVPSYFLCHTLRVPWFWQDRYTQRLIEWVASFFINAFDSILVPDYDGSPLSGDLSRDFMFINREKVRYIGILSNFSKVGVKRDIDYFISISGPEPQRSSFEKMLREQVQELKGNVVIVRGIPEGRENVFERWGRARVADYIVGPKRDRIMNRAKTVISRPGYSTLMDLIELGKEKVLFVPTPNQSEQEYLSRHHCASGNIYSVPQNKLDLARDVEKAQRYPGLPHKGFSTRRSVERLMEIVFAN